MTRIDYEGMCELFTDGKMIWVENELTNKKGRMVGCACEMIKVEVKGQCEAWNHDNCSEMTYGYRVKYGEVKKYPHEYDTHLD